MELSDIEFFGRGVDISLAAAECHRGDAVGREPVGVEAAVRYGEFDFPALSFDCVRGSDQARFDARAFTDRAGELVRRVESKVAGAPTRSP